MKDVENCKILTIVEKFLISPHDRCKKLKFTLFCCKISWFAVCAVLPWNLFCRDLRAFCVEKNWSQKCAMWRKNDKYDVWVSGLTILSLQLLDTLEWAWHTDSVKSKHQKDPFLLPGLLPWQFLTLTCSIVLRQFFKMTNLQNQVWMSRCYCCKACWGKVSARLAGLYFHFALKIRKW